MLVFVGSGCGFADFSESSMASLAFDGVFCSVVDFSESILASLCEILLDVCAHMSFLKFHKFKSFLCIWSCLL